MKKLSIITLITLAFMTSACANKPYLEAKEVNCKGYLDIKSTHKQIGIKLNKYDEKTNKFHSVANSVIVGSSWHTPQSFDRVECYDSGEAADMVNKNQNAK